MFEFSKPARLVKIEPRQGAGDNAKSAVLLRYEVSDVPAAAVTSALAADNAEEVIKSFFRPASQDVDQNVLYFGLKGLRCVAKWEDKHTLKLPNVRVTRLAKVSAIELVPRGKATFDCKFSAVIESPADGLIDSLLTMLNHETLIVLKQDGDLFSPKPDEAPAETQEGLPLEGGGDAPAKVKTPRVRKPKEPKPARPPKVKATKVAKLPKPAKAAKPKAKRKK